MSTNIRTTYEHGVPWEKDFGVTQARRVNDTIYISGQFAHDMEGNPVGEGDIDAQTRQTFANLDRVLAGFGLTKANLVDVVAYLTRPSEDFGPFVALYAEYMRSARPAATLVGVSGLAFPHQLVEVRAIAHA